MKKVFLAFTILCSTILAAQNTLRFYAISELEEYEQVLQKAIESDKMIFAVIYRENGGFAEMVKANVFRNDSLIKLYDQTIPIAVEANSNMGSRLLETFGTESLPAFYYLSNQELLTNYSSGVQSEESMIRAIAEAMDTKKSYKSLSDKYAEYELSTEEWIKLLRIYEMNFDFKRSQSVALEFLATLSPEQRLQEQIKPILLSYGIDMETGYPEFILKNRKSFNDTAYQNFFEAAYSYNFDRAADNSDTVLLEQIVEVLIPASPEPDSIQNLLQFESQKVFASETGEFSVWQRAAMKKAGKMEEDSLRADFLFSNAFEIADNFNSREAQNSARLLARKANQYRADFRYKMLEAYMAYLMKDFDEAAALVEEAKGLSKLEENQSKAERLSIMINNEKSKQNED